MGSLQQSQACAKLKATGLEEDSEGSIKSESEARTKAPVIIEVVNPSSSANSQPSQSSKQASGDVTSDDARRHRQIRQRFKDTRDYIRDHKDCAKTNNVKSLNRLTFREVATDLQIRMAMLARLMPFDHSKRHPRFEGRAIWLEALHSVDGLQARIDLARRLLQNADPDEETKAFISDDSRMRLAVWRDFSDEDEDAEFENPNNPVCDEANNYLDPSPPVQAEVVLVQHNSKSPLPRSRLWYLTALLAPPVAILLDRDYTVGVWEKMLLSVLEWFVWVLYDWSLISNDAMAAATIYFDWKNAE